MPSAFSGVAILAEDGEPVVTQTAGGVDPAMGFQIASGSKQFTACAVLLLADRGRLTLDDPLDRHLPGGQPGITIDQLLCHTSRIGHWESIPGLDLADPPSAYEVKDLILAAPLGKHGWVYSSPGYVLLAQLVQTVSGMPYAEFVTTEILEPLGLRDTTIAVPPPRAAPGLHGGRPIELLDLVPIPGPGDIWSSAADQLRFVQAIHVDRELLSPHSYQAMCAGHASIGTADSRAADSWRTEDGWLTGESMGYGIASGRIDGEPAYFHPGDNPGFKSFRAWLPASGRTVVVLSNEDTADPLAVVRDLLTRTER